MGSSSYLYAYKTIILGNLNFNIYLWTIAPNVCDDNRVISSSSIYIGYLGNDKIDFPNNEFVAATTTPSISLLHLPIYQ